MHCFINISNSNCSLNCCRFCLARDFLLILARTLVNRAQRVAKSQMQRLVLIFCILVLTSVSHISAQSCTTSEQCIDAELAPICRNGACSPCNESLSQECLDRSPNAPICSVGGCYACITSGSYATECGILFPSTPICVNDTGACRTCTADSECTVYGETVNCQDGACM